MPTMQILKQHWKDILIDLVSNARDKIYLSSPFIKEKVAKTIIANKNYGVDCKLLTKFTLSNMRGSGLDLSAVQSFKDNGFSLKNIDNLHAKIFIFDHKAIITSANLTNGGLDSNLEYGVLLENETEIENDFLSYYNDTNYQYIENEHISKVQNLLDKLPKIQKSKNLNGEMQIFAKELNKNLSTGNQKVFNSIEQVGSEIFTTQDIYQFKDQFAGNTPENTIRRNLQELRDIGLLEFVDKGVYKKLWS
jgi:phosphatidylserine/phosphatidylglycerophosphate/cardiolipin synthase-like enzyme